MPPSPLDLTQLVALPDADLLRALRYAEQEIVASQMADTYGPAEASQERDFRALRVACVAECTRRRLLPAMPKLEPITEAVAVPSAPEFAEARRRLPVDLVQPSALMMGRR